MACNGRPPAVASQSRWSLTWRRIAGMFDSQNDPLEVGTVIQPVVVVSDTSYAVGKPGWRGVISEVVTPAVALRRSAVAILAKNAPITVEWAYMDEVAFVVQRTVAQIETLMANDTVVSNVISLSGDSRQGASPNATIEVQTGDLDPAALPSPSFTTAPAAFGSWPEKLRMEVPLGNGVLIFCDTDNTAMLVTFEATEHRASG